MSLRWLLAAGRTEETWAHRRRFWSDMAVSTSEPLCQPCAYHEAFKGKSHHHPVILNPGSVQHLPPLEFRPRSSAPLGKRLRPSRQVTTPLKTSISILLDTWWKEDMHAVSQAVVPVCGQCDVQEMRGDVMKGLLIWLLYGQWSYRWRDLWCLSVWVPNRWAWRCCVSVDNWTSSSGHRCSR